MAKSGFSIYTRLNGLDATLDKLSGMKQSLRNKVMRPAIRWGSGVVSKAVKAKLKQERAGVAPLKKRLGKEGSNEVSVTARRLEGRLGILERAVGVIMRTSQAGKVYALIGPRRGFKELIGARLRDGTKSKKGDQVFEDAANIASVVELGHAGPHPAPPHPYMRPAFDETKAEVEKGMAERIYAGIAKLAKG